MNFFSNIRKKIQLTTSYFSSNIFDNYFFTSTIIIFFGLYSTIRSSVKQTKIDYKDDSDHNTNSDSDIKPDNDPDIDLKSNQNLDLDPNLTPESDNNSDYGYHTMESDDDFY